MNINKEKIRIWKEAFVVYLRVLFWNVPTNKGKNVKLPLNLIKHQVMSN
jgi:hypothetical protein